MEGGRVTVSFIPPCLCPPLPLFSEETNLKAGFVRWASCWVYGLRDSG